MFKNPSFLFDILCTVVWLVLMVHSQHGVVVQPAQPLGHAVPAAQLHRVALRKAEHKEIRL